MDVLRLTKTAGPWLHIEHGSVANFVDALRQWELAAPGKRVARIVRGRKCATNSELFNEFAAALQFPSDFGENWDALADSMRDWNWLPEKSSLAIGITDSENLLAKASASSFDTLTDLLHLCVHDTNEPSKPGKPRPLHIVFHCPKKASAAIAKLIGSQSSP